MTDALDPTSVRVTGVERQDPALRKLARAFIALARHQLGHGASTPSTAPAETPVTGPSGSEGGHE